LVEELVEMEITALRRRWMMFVDGENFCIRGQQFALFRGIALREGPFYRKDIFPWLPKLHATTFGPQGYPQQAIRSYYYTSLVGDEEKLLEVREELWALEFHPEVFDLANPVSEVFTDPGPCRRGRRPPAAPRQPA
jgi:hypothetical protein